MCCSKGVENLIESELELENPIIDQQHQAVDLMDSPTGTPGSNQSSNDEKPRVKFLCSFSGSIMPRPQDGKLRYVGGETRILSVPCDINYEELMGKMRELFEGATTLKYQQPDEDLDALVSVVNDDDVTNMMEEYDKLGSGDGFTRLRIFLFSNPDQDGSVHFGDGDERENERRYVDALNNLNESPEFRNQLGGSQVMGSLDDVNVAEQYFNQMSLEGSIHGQRNAELPMAYANLRQLAIPHLGSGQPQQPVSQRYSDNEAPWSPAYYSPRQPGTLDQKPAAEYPISPSSSRYRAPYGEFSDRNFDRMPEEYNRPPINHHNIYEQPLQYAENMVLVTTGPVGSENVGFPGNILHGTGCEHCQITFPRNQLYPDTPWKPGEQPRLEPTNMGNGYHPVTNSCVECPPNREMYTLNPDPNVHHPYFYNESRGHERGWVLQHQLNPRPDEPGPHVSTAGRLAVADNYIMENATNTPLGQGSLCDVHPVQSHYVHHEDIRYARPVADVGNQVFNDQAVATGSQVHVPSLDEHGVHCSNLPCTYGADNVYQVPRGHVPLHALWRNGHAPLLGGPSYETPVLAQLANGSVSTGFIRGTVDGSPRLRTELENQNPWVESPQKLVGFDESRGQAPTLVPTVEGPYTMQSNPSVPDMTKFAGPVTHLAKSDPAFIFDDKLVTAASMSYLRNDADIAEPGKLDEDSIYRRSKELNLGGEAGDTNMHVVNDKNPDAMEPAKSMNSVVESNDGTEVEETNASLAAELQEDCLSLLPEFVASVKEVALASLKVEAKVREDTDFGIEHNVVAGDDAQHDADGLGGNGDFEMGSDNDNLSNSKIEPTTAEAEAIDRGLQTIKNEDLEEIRELGSGTYGAVYHGKWKGSDVAIKRIKSSCFAGKPSERERLIADFWKEALILSSLHHPNVVAFYGVVRDGPDGSLATVTEFMVNGSLKQFLQKKDRTIDRRKRLMIAMDTAFGMEYLHGKNIVHFDLKCENLLVNMRDPHRPVCKIGDLGLSKVKQHTLVSGGVRGTLPWMAPELLSGKSSMVTEKIDVYSFGIVMWELLTGDEPYADMHCASIIGGIVNNTLRPQIPTWCDPEWKSLMESCWACDPAERPSFSEISQRLRNMAAGMNLK
ncbi:uncharacterized protein LOC111387282 [Olea europaea var. sylvestris]|uniref:uncharacterized protein LOC111387282 n=1 Tax=Olea europaea var. sylvestris TaxID=158386 RepID=UPI000C1D8078|nr:uncharacterized protein LOC111387282 [Olea europaea var. sylvestris]XP_022867592.1 uncharacterized protein LOC111387282 [Olea europaea var. sylvestris]